MKEPPLIKLSSIRKFYTIANKQRVVLDNLSLTIARGEMVAIVGRSGSGKSTLMNIIGLLDTINAGHYCLKGQAVAELSPNALALLRNRHIGFVFQQFHLLPRFCALQNVALPLTYRAMSPASLQQDAWQALKRVGMEDYVSQKPAQLSGGQQQRVAIARALVGNPTIILADEPTGALDTATGQGIMDLFLNLHQEGRTVVIVTHDERIAAQCKRCITLDDGKLITDSVR